MARKMESINLGNTKSKLMKRRDYMLTVNEESIKHYDDIKNYLPGRKSITYYLCVEHLNSKRKHYHILVQFDNSVILSIKKLYGCHIDVLNGTPQEAYNYIMCKDEKHIKKCIVANIIDEIGNLRYRGTILNVRALEEMNKEDLKDIDIRLYKRACEIKNEINEEELLSNMLNDIKNDDLKSPEIVYIHGYPGSGKTYGAYKYALEHYNVNDIGKISINNNFFKIINDNAKCFIIEEFRPSQISASEFLQFTDKYVYTASIKGGFKTIRPECIIICCYKHPNKLYKDENNLQFKRRVSKWFKAEEHKLIECKFEDLNDDDDDDVVL